MIRKTALAFAASLVVALVAAPRLAAEEPPTACTLIGCSSGVHLDVVKVKDGVGRLSFCVRDRCQRFGVKKHRPWGGVTVECSAETDVRAILTTKDSAGHRIARYSTMVHLEKSQPNGPQCEPTCFSGTVRFTGNRLVAVPPS